MRLALTVLAVSLLATQAMAQIVPQQPNTVQPTAPATTATAPRQQLEEIGYDPKVKRDPYGNIIGEPKEKEAPKTESQKLRHDTGSNLRSDRNMFNTRAAAAAPKPPETIAETPVENAVGAPLITPDGKPVTVEQAAPPPARRFTPVAR